MYQTFARVIGTIIVAQLLALHIIPASLGLTPTEIEYIGDAVLIGIMASWHYLELYFKGLTINSPHPASNLPGSGLVPKNENTPALPDKPTFTPPPSTP